MHIFLPKTVSMSVNSILSRLITIAMTSIRSLSVGIFKTFVDDSLGFFLRLITLLLVTSKYFSCATMSTKVSRQKI